MIRVSPYVWGFTIWYTLWLCNIAVEAMAHGNRCFSQRTKPPFMLGIFHGYVSHNQRVYHKNEGYTLWLFKNSWINHGYFTKEPWLFMLRSDVRNHHGFFDPRSCKIYKIPAEIPAMKPSLAKIQLKQTGSHGPVESSLIYPATNRMAAWWFSIVFGMFTRG